MKTKATKMLAVLAVFAMAFAGFAVLTDDSNDVVADESGITWNSTSKLIVDAAPPVIVPVDAGLEGITTNTYYYAGNDAKIVLDEEDACIIVLLEKGKMVSFEAKAANVFVGFIAVEKQTGGYKALGVPSSILSGTDLKANIPNFDGFTNSGDAVEAFKLNFNDVGDKQSIIFTDGTFVSGPAGEFAAYTNLTITSKFDKVTIEAADITLTLKNYSGFIEDIQFKNFSGKLKFLTIDSADAEILESESGKIIIPKGKTFNAKGTIGEDVAVDVKGTLGIVGGGSLINNGIIYVTDSAAVIPNTIGGYGQVDRSAVSEIAYLNGICQTSTQFGMNQIVYVNSDTVLKNGTKITVEGKIIVESGVKLLIEDGAQLVVESSSACFENYGNVIIESIKQSGRGESTNADHCGGLVINGEGYNAGTITLDHIGAAEKNVGLWYANGDGEYGFWAMSTWGRFVNDGTIEVGDESALYMGKYFLNGETGVIYIDGVVDMKEKFLNAGYVQMNGYFHGAPIVKMVGEDAVFEIITAKQIGEGAITIDLSIIDKFYDGEALPAYSCVVINYEDDYELSGLTVSVASEYDVDFEDMYVFWLDIAGSVTLAAIDTSSQENITPAEITLSGYNEISTEFITSKYVDVINNGFLMISGEAYINSGAIDNNNDLKPETFKDKVKAIRHEDNPKSEITVTGLLRTTSQENGTVNAAYYRVSATADSDAYYIYTSFAEAVKSGTANVDLYGTIEVDEYIEIPAGTTVNMRDPCTIIILEDGMISVLDGGAIKNTTTANTISVVGFLYIENVATGVKNTSIVEAQAVAEEYLEAVPEDANSALYGMLADIIPMLNEYSMKYITVMHDVIVDADLYIPENTFVTFMHDDNASDIYVADGFEIYNEGVIYLGEAQIFAYSVDPADSASAGKEKLVNDNLVIADYDGIFTQFEGATFDIEVAPDTYYYLAPIDIALEMSDVVVYYGDANLRDVEVIGSKDVDPFEPKDPKFDSEFSKALIFLGNVDATSIALDYAAVYFAPGDASKPNTVKAEIIGTTGSIDLDDVKIGANGFVAADAVWEDDGETYFLVAGQLAGGEVTADGVVCFEDNTIISNLVIDGDAYLDDVLAGVKLTVNGSLYVDLGGKVTFGYADVFGDVEISEKVGTEKGGLFTVSYLNIGIETTTTNGVASVTGPTAVEKLASVAAGATAPEAVLDMKYSSDVTIDGELWFTIYSDKSDNVLTIDRLLEYFDPLLVNAVMKKVTIDGTDYYPAKDGKFYVPDTDPKESVKIKLGQDVEFVTDAALFSITIYAEAGVKDMYLNGKLMVKGGTGALTSSTEFTLDKLVAGTYTVTYILDDYYSADKAKFAVFTGTGFGADASVTNGKLVISEGEDGNVYAAAFTLTGLEKVSPVDPEPQPEPQQVLTVTEILLIVLVIIIAIMAVVLILRLNRS